MKKRDDILVLNPGQVISFSEDEEKKLVHTICDLVGEILLSRKKLTENLITWRKNYEMVADEKSFPWQGSSNLKEPVTEIAVDAIWSRLDRNLLAYDPLFLVEPFFSDDEDLKHSARKYERFIDWDFDNNILNAYKVLSDWLFSSTLDGCSFIKLSWLRKVYALRSRAGKKIIIRDAPQFSYLDLLDVIFPAHAQFVDETYIAQRLWLSLNDLIIRKEKFGYKIPDGLGEWVSKEDKDEFEREVFSVEGIEQPRKYNPYLPSHMLFEWWGEYRIKGKLIPIVATVFYKERKLARAIINPFRNLIKPFVSISVWPRPGRILGRGIGQKLMHLQAEIDTIHNQRIDATTLRIAPMFKMREGALSPDDQEFYPLKFFELQDLNDVQEWQLSEVKASGYQEEVILHGLAEKSTSVSDYTLGRESSVLQTRATATGTLAVIQEGDKKFDKKVQNVSIGFKELINKVDILYKENMSRDVPIPDLKDILTPEEIGERYKFEFKPSKLTINREVRQQKDLQILSIFSQNPVLAQNLSFMKKVARELLTTFEKFELAKYIDEDKTIKTMEQVQDMGIAIQYLQSVMALLAAQQQVSGGGAPPGTPPEAPPGAPPGEMPPEGMM